MSFEGKGPVFEGQLAVSSSGSLRSQFKKALSRWARIPHSLVFFVLGVRQFALSAPGALCSMLRPTARASLFIFTAAMLGCMWYSDRTSERHKSFIGSKELRSDGDDTESTFNESAIETAVALNGMPLRLRPHTHPALTPLSTPNHRPASSPLNSPAVSVPVQVKFQGIQPRRLTSKRHSVVLPEFGMPTRHPFMPARTHYHPPAPVPTHV